MKYKRTVYTPFILIIASLKLIASVEEPNKIREIAEKYNHASNLERIIATWNKSSEIFHENTFPKEIEEEEIFDKPNPDLNFPSQIHKCIESHQYQIMENFTQGKNIMLNCFKAALILNVLRYLEMPSRTSVRLFNGLLEFKKVSGKMSSKCNDIYCDKKYNRNFGTIDKKKDEYIRIYKKAMQKLINERSRLNSFRNLTQEEKANQLSRINENSQAFISEVIRNLGNEDMEKMEEEMLRKEITDPKLLSVLDTLTKDYMVKFRFYPGVSARMMRSNNGGFTFDLEIQDSEEGLEEESSSDESSTREIKDGPQAKDYFDDDDDGGGNVIKKKNKKNKKKKKEIKKKEKKLKKIIPYLLLPMLIQMTLLPFVFKKLFFLAMKALFAGKVALILVGFNLLRNTCIKNEEDYNQKIRVEHYGYRKGEEYGAWINGRSLKEPKVKTALNEEPYRGHKPVS